LLRDDRDLDISFPLVCPELQQTLKSSETVNPSSFWQIWLSFRGYRLLLKFMFCHDFDGMGKMR
jgi:hypothetical protein